MKTFYLSALIAIVNFLSGCSLLGLTGTNKVDITTDPVGVKVSIVSKNGERDLGVTPLSLPAEDIFDGTDPDLNLKFTMEGFDNHRLLTNTYTTKINGEIHVKMSPVTDWSAAFVDSKASKYLEDVASLTAKIQGAIASKKYSQGENFAKQLTGRYPNLAVAWSLLGNVYYLQKRKSEAMSAYSKAVTLNPEDVETRNAMESLEK